MNKLLVWVSILLAPLLACVTTIAIAEALQSSHFQFNETSLGGIGTADTHSAGYKALTSGGIFGFADTEGTIFKIDTGHETTDEPALSFAVASSGLSFGSFSPTTTATATSTFAVKDYTSYGYVVQTLGNAPSNGGHTITAMSSTGSSAVGTEQFGINLVANTSPSTFGANPDHGQFGFGSPSGNYGTPDNYRFVSGETVALAPKSSGTTIYTISYIVNVSSITPGGQYSGDQTILCTATF